MRRDEAASEAEYSLNVLGNLSTVPHTQTSVSSTILPNSVENYLNLTDLVTTGNNSGTDRQFFHSYDPHVGINTAIFLGGLLLFLVIYVTYRTKCRKKLIETLQKCSMKYFPEEFPPNEIITCQPHSQQQQEQEQQQQPIQTDTDVTIKSAEWISERAKMIWQERALLAKDPDGIKCVGAADQGVSNEDHIDLNAVECEVVAERTLVNSNECPMLEVPLRVQDVALQLPEVEENIEQATAQWVRNVREMDCKEKELNGIILKIPPDLVSHSAKLRSHFHSVTDYTNDFVRISVRNKSLPLLTEQSNMIYSTYARVEGGDRAQNGYNYTPISTQDEMCEPPAQQLQVQHQSGTKVPLDICPIVKVQHYHSRSKRRLTSMCRNSSEDNDSTSSSEDSCTALVQSAPETLGQAKYIRLHTGERHCSDDGDRIPFQTNAGMPNNISKCFPKGNLETSL